MKESESHSVMSDSLRPHGLYSPWNSPGQNTGAGSLSLFQGIFPTQGWNPGFPHCRQILYQLSHQGSPRILEWVAYLFSADLPDPGIEPGSPALHGKLLIFFPYTETYHLCLPLKEANMKSVKWVWKRGWRLSRRMNLDLTGKRHNLLHRLFCCSCSIVSIQHHTST